MINTGEEAIPPNSCLYWDFPSLRDVKDGGLSCQKIKGHPDGAIYPVIKVYDIVDISAECVEKTSRANMDDKEKKDKIHDILAKQERIIGWSLNHAEPGGQLDVILKR